MTDPTDEEMNEAYSQGEDNGYSKGFQAGAKALRDKLAEKVETSFREEADRCGEEAEEMLYEIVEEIKYYELEGESNED